MIQNTTASHAATAAIPVDTTVFAVFGVSGAPVFLRFQRGMQLAAAFFVALSSRVVRPKRMAHALPHAAQAMTAALAAARRLF
ncbi:hypothetical protein [Ralstonia flaminis]|jgi:hypothetical protein|uniref:Uncharacterized protein n=1 Tax=Ralstonia flaminis TaxID=3058597 RepID=A0ABN9JGB8_9RALS|nr:hypothetical protein [Ralstonia sp. LMG 18101]CAJ0810864.1 hypothetical protein LMG18101_01022 [Ralstonia sp. LMG 18101]